MKVEAFTFFRFIAALIVVIFHYGSASDVKKLAPELLNSGPQMVTFFFVLSGYVMVIAYYNKKEFSPNKYWLNRIARICPVYFAALAIFVIHSMRYNHISAVPFLLNLSLLQSWFSPYPLSLNSPGWSLSVEAFFYATFPFTILVIRNKKISHHLAIYASLSIWLVTQIILIYFLNSSYFKGFGTLLFDLIFYFPISHYCSFLIGIAGAYYMLETNKSGLIEKVIGSSFIFMLLATFLILNNQGLIASWLGFNLPMGSSFLAPLFLVLIMSIALSRNFLTKVLTVKPLVILGEASYSLYILQAPVHNIYKELISPRFGLSSSHDFYMFTFVLVVASICSFYLVEMPGKNIVLKTTPYLKNKIMSTFALKADC